MKLDCFPEITERLISTAKVVIYSSLYMCIFSFNYYS